MKKVENILFTNFYYVLTNNGAGVPDANSYVKVPNQIDEYLENDLSEVQSFKITLNCQVDTNRNTAPIQTQALIKGYDIEIDKRTRQFFIEKQNFLHMIFNNKKQTAQQFLDNIKLIDTTILKIFNQFWQDNPIQIHVQVQIECCY